MTVDPMDNMPGMDMAGGAMMAGQLGGYTMIAIAGGITSLAHFREFCASPEADGACQAPPEFGDLRAKARTLADRFRVEG